MWLIYLFLTVGLGWRLSRLIPWQQYFFEYVASSVVLGFFFSGWLILLSVIIFGWNWGLWIALLVMALLIWRLPSKSVQTLKVSGWTKRLIWILSIGFGVLLAALFKSHCLEIEPNGWYTGGGAWGDYGLHMALISSFAHQSHFSWDFTLFEGAKLTYPFIIDLISAVYLRLGSSWQLAMGLPSWLLGMALVQLYFGLVLRLSKRAGIAGISTLFLFLGGSTAGFGYFWADYQASGVALGQFLANQPNNYTNIASRGIIFSNYIGEILIPQRGFVLGMGVVTIALSLLYQYWTTKEHKSLLYFLAILIGLLPFGHTHSFLFIYGLFLFFVIWECCIKQAISQKKIYLKALLLATILALPQLIWQFKANYSSGFIHLEYGWMSLQGQSFALFWWKNWGPIIFLSILSIVFLLKKKNFYSRIFFWGLVVFGLANLVVFQPNNWDNIKLFIYAYYVLIMLFAYWLVWLSDRLGEALIGLLVIWFCAAGVVSVVKEYYNHDLLLTNSDLDFAASFEQVVPADALVLTSDFHRHPVSTLTGRRIVMGYRGWLWTYGLDYRPTEAKVSEIYQGGAKAQQYLQEMKVDYVVIGTSEIQEWGARSSFFRQKYSLVMQQDGYQVYKVK